MFVAMIATVSKLYGKREASHAQVPAYVAEVIRRMGVGGSFSAVVA
jgi:hypothetical protein